MKRMYLLSVAVFVLFSFTACEENKVRTKKEEIKTVFITTPKAKNEDEKRVFTAQATSNKEIKLSFKVQGNITHLKHKIGDDIKKGELVAKLDSKPYELKVSQINYALSEAKTKLINAKSNYERVKKLYINQNASASDIDNAKASYNAAIAKVENIKKQLDYAKLKLSYTKLYSPISGYISLKFVQENENIDIGTPIVLISDKLIDEVTVQLPENIINKVKKDEKVKVVFNSLGSKSYSAKVYEISKYSSSKSKTYKVVVKLDKPTTKIKSGMSADIYFDLVNNKAKRVFYIPSRSVLKDKKGHFVYIALKDDKYHTIKKRYIKVGKLTSKGYEVLDNINGDELVLKAGMTEVFESMKVKIENRNKLGQ